MARLPLSLAVLGTLAAVAPLPAMDDWPQWMGPNRDGVWKETGTVEKFPAGGPKKLWATKVGGGYAGPAVAGGRVFLPDYVKKSGDDTPNPAKKNALTGTERVLCFDAKTGEPLWKHEYDCPYEVSYPAGPRCTPTVDGDRVYTLGAMGNLFCLTADKGTVVWQKDFKKDYQAKTPTWGFTGHPLVYKDLLVCLVGGDGSVAVAFDKKTGKEVWKALSAPEPGYCPPTIIHAGGTDQLVIWHAKSINGLDPLTGKKYWGVPLEPNYGMAIMSPRQGGDFLFAGGIGGKAVLLKLDREKPAATEVWRGKKETAIYPVNMTPMIEDGVLYGVDQPGQLRAVKLETGERLWATFKPVLGVEKEATFNGGGSGTAFVVKHGAGYVLFNEVGELILADLSPGGYTEVSKAKLIETSQNVFGRKVVWTHPAFADKCVFVRNDKELLCFSLAKE